MQTQSRFRLGMNLLVLSFLSILLHNADGSCIFPSDLTGSWRSSRWGDVTFSSNILTVTDLSIGTVTFECETQSGSIYILRSTTTVTVLTNQVDVVTCLDLRQLSSTKFYYYYGTPELPFVTGANEPVKLVSPSSTVNVTTACTITSPYAGGTNHILLKSGSEANAGVQCPNPLLANFNNYTIDKGSGPRCGTGDYISICDDRQTINVDSNQCGEKLFYSNEGPLKCVYSSQSGSTYYANVYNMDSSVDSSNTFRFSCIAVAYGSDGYVYATQYPRTCADTQTSTSVPSSPFTGGILQLMANVTCVPTTASDDSNVGGIVAAVIVLLVVAVLVGLAVYHLGYRKRWPLVRQKLPCLKGQVDPQPPVEAALGEEGEEPRPGDTSTSPLAGQQVNVVTTAVVSQDPVQKVKSSSSSRSIVTPSKLHPDLSEGSPEQQALNPTPRRLPPLNPADLPELPSVVQDEKL